MALITDLTEPQSEMFADKTSKLIGVVAGLGCLHPATKIITKEGLIPISEITSPTQVLSWNEKYQKFVFSLSSGSFQKGIGKMYRVSTKQGEFVANEHHRIFSSQRVYEQASSLSVGDKLLSLPSHCLTTEGLSQLSSSLDELHCPKTIANYLERYANAARQYGQQPLLDQDISQSFSPLKDDVQELYQYLYSFSSLHKGDLLELRQERNRLYQFFFHLCSIHSFCQTVSHFSFLVNRILKKLLEHILHYLRSILQSELMSELHHNTGQYSFDDHSFESLNSSDKINVVENDIIHINEDGVNVFYDMQVFETNNYVTEDGTIHHNSGKTKSLLTKCVADLIKYQTDLAYYAPTHSLVRKIAFPVFSEILEGIGIKYHINKSEGIIYTNFGKIMTFSLENSGVNLIGYEVLRSYVDEFDILSKSNALAAFDKLSARARKIPTKGPYKGQDGLNRQYICTTPEGHKAMYQMFEKEPMPGSRLIRMSTYSNPHLPADYIPRLEAQYNDNLIKAYLNGEFKNLTYGCVYDFKRDQHVINEKYIDRDKTPTATESIHIGQDFNVGKMASIIFINRKNSSGGDVWLVIDEIIQGRDTPDVIAKIKERYPRNPIFIYPDASGKNKHSSNYSKSDHTLLRQANFTVRVNSKNPFIKDRVASVNNAFAKKKVFISGSCLTIIESLEQQVYDKDGMPSKDGDNDHSNDAFGYFICKMMPVATSIARYQAVSHI